MAYNCRSYSHRCPKFVVLHWQLLTARLPSQAATGMSQTNPSDAWASGRPHCGCRKKQLLAPDSPAMVNQSPPMQMLGHKGWTRNLSKHFLKFQAQTPQMFVSACSLVLVLCATLPDCLVAVLFGPCINISCCWQSNFGARQSVICSSGIVVSLADLIESLQNVWDSLQSKMDPRPRRVLDQGRVYQFWVPAAPQTHMKPKQSGPSLERLSALGP